VSEPIVLAKVVCHNDGATFNVRWDDETIRPIPCPLCGGPTTIKIRDVHDGATAAWIVVDENTPIGPQAEPAPEPAPEPEQPEEQPQA
jgi:hypothetical protein